MPVRGLLVVAALLVSVPAAAIAAPKAATSTSQFQLNKARIDKALAQEAGGTIQLSEPAPEILIIGATVPRQG